VGDDDIIPSLDHYQRFGMREENQPMNLCGGIAYWRTFGLAQLWVAQLWVAQLCVGAALGGAALSALRLPVSKSNRLLAAEVCSAASFPALREGFS
jgi:hypothetical protein